MARRRCSAVVAGALAPALLLALGCGSIPGPDVGHLYLHNAEREKLAKEALEEFEAYSKDSLDVFTKMERNLAHTDEAWHRATSTGGRVATDTFIQALPLMTWGKVREVLAQATRELDQARADARASLSELTDELTGARAAGRDAKKALSDLEKALKEQEQANASWAQEVEDLREKLVASATGGADGSAAAPPDLVRQAFELDLEPAPGLETTILGLAIDLAEGERDRIAAEVVYLKDAIRNANTQIALLGESDANARELDTSFKLGFPLIKAADGSPLIQDGDRVGTTIATLRARYDEAADAGSRAKRFSELQMVLETVGRIALVQSVFIPEIRSLQVDAASLIHRRSIHHSRVYAQMREDIISRGLQGLSIYHAGGIRSEEIAEFVYAAGLIAALSL